jgi:hypothetical protein
MMVMGVIILNFIIQRRMTQAMTFTVIAAVTAVLLYAPSFIKNLGKGVADSVSDKPVQSSPAETPSTPATPPVSDVSDSPKLPWEMLGFVGLVIVGIIVLSVSGVVVYKKYSSSANNRNANIAGWNKVMGHHNEIRKAWNAYEMDMAKVIDFPFMNDMREPAIAALHKALRKSGQLEPSSVKVVSHVPFADSPFAKSVQDLQVAFDTAESEAKRVAWNKFTADERKRLSTAKGLLALAMDQGASASERQVAYKRVIKELEGLVHIPEKAILEIEASAQKELEMA